MLHAPPILCPLPTCARATHKPPRTHHTTGRRRLELNGGLTDLEVLGEQVVASLSNVFEHSARLWHGELLSSAVCGGGIRTAGRARQRRNQTDVRECPGSGMAMRNMPATEALAPLAGRASRATPRPTCRAGMQAWEPSSSLHRAFCVQASD